VTPLAHATNAELSSAQRNVAAVGSLDVNVNVAVVKDVGLLGPLETAVSGGVASTVQVNDAGVRSTLPAGSFARTWNVCGPSASPV
jgi:hypothetical protein